MYDDLTATRESHDVVDTCEAYLLSKHDISRLIELRFQDIKMSKCQDE